MSVDPIETSEAVPRGAIVERTGEMSRAFRNWLERGNRQQGKVISGIATLNSAVQVIQGQITEIDGSLSTYYGISVDGGGNGAILRLSDGASFGSAISLSADEITLDADAINFGSQTEFDTSTETFITEAGGVRTRYGAPFGASSDVLRWYGPTSVAQGSETKTNGYLAEGTDGVLYIGTAPVGWGATAAEAAASNARVPVGVNALVDTEFQRGLYAWQAGWAGNSGLPHTVAINLYGAAARNYYAAALTGTPAAGTVFDVLACRGSYLAVELANTKLFCLPVNPGERIYGGARFSGEHISSAAFSVIWLAADGSVIYPETLGSTAPAPRPLGQITSWDRIGGFGVAPAGAAFVIPFFRATCNGTANPYCAVTSPMLARVPANQTEAPPYAPGRPDPKGDYTPDNTAAAIAGQGNGATANHQRGATFTGTPTEGSTWADTTTNTYKLYTGGVWVIVATIGNQNITISRTNGFVKTRNGAGTITSDSVSFSSTGGSGTGYTYAHELLATYTTGPTPTISSASGSPITASAAGAVPGDEIRGFVQTAVTDSAGNKATLLSPVALFCES